MSNARRTDACSLVGTKAVCRVEVLDSAYTFLVERLAVGRRMEIQVACRCKVDQLLGRAGASVYAIVPHLRKFHRCPPRLTPF